MDPTSECAKELSSLDPDFAYNTEWDGQSWTKMVIFHCIGLHVSLKLMLGLKSTGCCVLGCWITIYSMKAIFFTTMASRRQSKELQVLRKYTTASRSHSAAMDGCRAARLGWGIAWTFTCKTLQIEKSSEFKSDKYGGQFTGIKNSADNRLVVSAV